MENSLVSIVVLTYNRPKEIYRNISELTKALNRNIQIIVIDNNSCSETQQVLNDFSDRIEYVRLAENIGVGARNIGIEKATSKIVITLDDDVFGLSEREIEYISERFSDDDQLAALNFSIVDDVTDETINWIHHRKSSQWKSRSFETYEISEGAVALNKNIFMSVGGYLNYFFISHEGPELAIRLLNGGGSVFYDPNIVVRHAHSEQGRESWRRYYYDSRNVIWLVILHYPFSVGVQKLVIELGALFIYSVRDGFIKYWFKGIYDALKNIRSVYRERSPMNKNTRSLMKMMMSKNPSLFYMIKVRLLSGKKKVGI